MPVSRIDPVAFKARLDAGEPLVVLDVREVFEREIATIPLPATANELTIPMGEIHARYEELIALADGRAVVVYCHHGQRSMVAARWLDARGIPGLLNLEGGIDVWTARVDPTTPHY